MSKRSLWWLIPKSDSVFRSIFKPEESGPLFPKTSCPAGTEQVSELNYSMNSDDRWTFGPMPCGLRNGGYAVHSVSEGERKEKPTEALREPEEQLATWTQAEAWEHLCWFTFWPHGNPSAVLRADQMEQVHLVPSENMQSTECAVSGGVDIVGEHICRISAVSEFIILYEWENYKYVEEFALCSPLVSSSYLL